MAKTLLNGVSEVLKKSGLGGGAGGDLASLVDPPRQKWIDQIVQLWNEEMEELYSTVGKPMPQELSEGTITLADGDRDYALTAYNTLYFPLLDETNGRYIYEWAAGYLDLVNFQTIPSDWTGLPLYGAIRPTDGQLYLDRIPQSDEAGLVYKYRFDKDVSLSNGSDTFPFTDTVFRALVPAVAEKFKRETRGDFSEGIYAQAHGRAARELSGERQKSHYGMKQQPRVGGIFAPFEDR